MNRPDFLKLIGGTASSFFLGHLAFGKEQIAMERKTIVIYDNFVRGTNFYRKNYFTSQPKQNEKVTLKRDAENIYDSFAIGVFLNDLQLGYLAAYENIVLANLLDSGVKLEAYVSEVKLLSDKKDILQNVFSVCVCAELMVPISLNENKIDKRADEATDVYRKGYRLDKNKLIF